MLSGISWAQEERVESLLLSSQSNYRVRSSRWENEKILEIGAGDPAVRHLLIMHKVLGSAP